VTLFDEGALRTLISEEVRRAVREELERKPRSPESLTMVSVAEAARLCSVAPQTIRAWGRAGRLTLHRAGRVWRVRVADLEALLVAGGPQDREGTDLSPEEFADRDFVRRRRRKLPQRGRATADGQGDDDDSE
jgi:excisionase family DNA binding protein